jgi:CO dehydrogenase/acetyl-CoA synthase gamma subunit (corrinoid Fe-S protein)
MLTNKIITINKYYYDKDNCRFVLCESCWWFATILKDVSKVIQCPRCKKKKEIVYRKNSNNIVIIIIIIIKKIFYLLHL